jgi:hypothetical protein
MTALPAAVDFTGGGVTEGGFKTAMTTLRAYLNDLFGADGTPATARATLGFASPILDRTMPGPIGGATPDTGAFTSLTTTLNATIGNGAAALTRGLQVKGGSDAGKGAYIEFLRGAASAGFLGPFAGIVGGVETSSDLTLYATGSNEIRMHSANHGLLATFTQFGIKVPGVVYTGAPSLVGSAGGDMVTPNASWYRSANVLNDNTIKVIRANPQNFVEIGGGYGGTTLQNGVIINGVTDVNLPMAGAALNGLVAIDVTNHRLCFYEGGARYYVQGTAF